MWRIRYSLLAGASLAAFHAVAAIASLECADNPTDLGVIGPDRDLATAEFVIRNGDIQENYVNIGRIHMRTKIFCKIALAISALSVLPFNVYASKTIDFEGALAERGFELSESGMRKALASRDNSVVYHALRYIEQEQFVTLVPDVKLCLEYWEKSDVHGEGTKLHFVQCLLAIEKDMTEEQLGKHLQRIRRMLFEVKKGDKDFQGVPVHAYNALLAAHKYWDIDIFDDLLHLSSTDIMLGGDYPFTVKDLFEFYGDSMSESDLDTLLSAWPDLPKRREYILRHARAHGMRLAGNDIPDGQGQTAPPAK